MSALHDPRECDACARVREAVDVGELACTGAAHREGRGACDLCSLELPA